MARLGIPALDHPGRGLACVIGACRCEPLAIGTECDGQDGAGAVGGNSWSGAECRRQLFDDVGLPHLPSRSVPYPQNSSHAARCNAVTWPVKRDVEYHGVVFILVLGGVP